MDHVFQLNKNANSFLLLVKQESTFVQTIFALLNGINVILRMDALSLNPSNVPMESVLVHLSMDLEKRVVNPQSNVPNILHIYVLMENALEINPIVMYRNHALLVPLSDVLISVVLHLLLNVLHLICVP